MQGFVILTVSFDSIISYQGSFSFNSFDKLMCLMYIIMNFKLMHLIISLTTEA